MRPSASAPPPPPSRDLSDTATVDDEGRRRANLRQVLLRASRAVNRQIVAALNARGYDGLRSTHTALLSHMDLAGSTVTAAAERAGMTKQAMGRIATELEALGYVATRPDPRDGRARLVTLTRAGRALMAESLRVMADLERRYADVLGADRFATVLDGLDAITTDDSPPGPA